MSRLLTFVALPTLLAFAACKTDAPTSMEDLPATGSAAPSEQSLDPAGTTDAVTAPATPSAAAGTAAATVAGPAIDAVTGYIDPVCQMKVAQDAQVRATFEDVTFGFCSEACKSRFAADPEKYLAALEE